MASKPNQTGKKSTYVKPNNGHGIETDAKVLARRQKQIDYGKNTEGYQNYRRFIKWEERTDGMPNTPNKYTLRSRRAFDKEIKAWRIALHRYDHGDSGCDPFDVTAWAESQSTSATLDSEEPQYYTCVCGRDVPIRDD